MSSQVESSSRGAASGLRALMRKALRLDRDERYAEALEAWEHCLRAHTARVPTTPHAHAVHDHTTAFLLAHLGHTFHHLKRPRDAVRCLMEAIALSRSRNDRDNQLRVHHILEDVYKDLGDHERADEHRCRGVSVTVFNLFDLARSVTLGRQELASAGDDAQRSACAHLHLGIAHYNLSDHDQAHMHLDDALDHARQVDPIDRATIARATHMLGRVHTALSNHRAALKSLQWCDEMEQRRHDGPRPHILAALYRDMAAVFEGMGAGFEQRAELFHHRADEEEERIAPVRRVGADAD